MSTDVSYKANDFMKNINRLLQTFETYTKFSSFLYKDTGSYFVYVENELNYYTSFYVTRIENLLKSFETLFSENEIDLSSLNDSYELQITFTDDYAFERIVLKIPEIIEDKKLIKGFATLAGKQYEKDIILMNYLINLDNMLKEVDGMPWHEWVIKHTSKPLKLVSFSQGETFQDKCFDKSNVLLNSILDQEISNIDLLAYQIKNKGIQKFDSFFQINPRTTNPENGQTTEKAKADLKYLNSIKDVKGIKLSDKLRVLASKVDGSDESLSIILQNLTVENFTSLLEELMKCVPGVLTFKELLGSILDGSFESLTLDFFSDLFDSLPLPLRNILISETDMKFPWESGATDLSLLWFEALVKNFDKALQESGFLPFFQYQKKLTALSFPSVMYYVIKMHFKDEVGDTDFREKIPELEQTLEEYAFANFGRISLELPLKYGQKNTSVKFLQKILNNLGYTDDKKRALKETGKFNSRTKQAVKNFQRVNVDSEGVKLEVDGKVGPKTYSALQPTEDMKDVFELSKEHLEGFMIDLFTFYGKLQAEFPEILDGMPWFPEPQILSFSSFMYPKISIPNFKDRELTGKDFKDLFDFVNVYFPSYDPRKILVGEGIAGRFSPISIESENLYSYEKSLTKQAKISFYKVLYETVISSKDEKDLTMKGLFDSIFFGTKTLVQESSTILENKETEQYYSKLMTSLVSKEIPNIAQKTLDTVNIDYEALVFEKIQSIPQIKSMVNILSPQISNFPSVKVEGFRKPDFDLSRFKLPEIPEIPSIKFNLMEFISEKLFMSIRRVVFKIILTLLAKVIDKITLEICNDPQSNGIQNPIPDGGLTSIMEEIACPDKDPIESGEVFVDNTLKSMGSPDQNTEVVSKAVEALSLCATTEELIPEILGDNEKKVPGFLGKMSDVMKTVVPEIVDYVGSPEKLGEMFQSAGSLLNQEQKEQLQNLISQIPDVHRPVEATICLTRDEVEVWRDERENLFVQAGFDPEVAKEFVDKQRQRASSDLKGLIEDALKTPESLFSDSIDEILKDEECNELINPPETKETIKDISNDLLNNINSTLIEDMLEESFLFGDFKGALSRILSDKYGRSMSEILNIKKNFLLNLLISFGVIPAPEYAQTIFKDLTDKLNNLSYKHTDQTLETQSIEEKPLFSIPVLSSIRQTVASYSYKKANLSLSYDKNNIDSVDYMDYLVNQPSSDGIKIGLDILTPSSRFSEEFVEKFSDQGLGTSTSPRQMFSYIAGQENLEIYDRLNEKLLDYAKSLFAVDVESGFPAEITSSDISFSGGDNSTKTLATLDSPDPNGRVTLLDPEIYGGSYTKPKIFIKPPSQDILTGFYGYSKRLFSEDEATKLDRTILKLSEVSSYIDNVKPRINQNRFQKSLGIKNILERPYANDTSREKIAQAWGHIKILIRVYLAEFFTLGYPVIRVLGVKKDNYGELLSSYIVHRIEKDMQDFKVIGSADSTYTPYVAYMLILEQVVAEYIQENKEDDYFSLRSQEYTPLSSEDIELIKDKSHNSLLLSAINQKFDNFVRGFAILSFGENWQNVLNSISGFNISVFDFEESELRLASRLGYISRDLDRVRDTLKLKVQKEMSEYEKVFEPEINDISTDFLFSQNGLNLTPSYNPPTNDFYLKKYIKVTEKDGNSYRTDISELRNLLLQFPDATPISDNLGNAKIDSLYDLTYTGSIGIMFGVSFGFKGREIVNFEEDIQDLLIEEVKQMDENLNSDVACFVDKLLKTGNGELLFKYCLKVNKMGSLMAIHFMRNAISSVGEGPQESKFQFDLLGSAIELVGNAMGDSPISIYSTTKKDILNKIVSFLRREIGEPREEKESFSDFKSNQTIEANFDSKTLKINGTDAIPFFKRFLITDRIPLDKDGNPIVSKFLFSLFSEGDE